MTTASFVAVIIAIPAGAVAFAVLLKLAIDRAGWFRAAVLGIVAVVSFAVVRSSVADLLASRLGGSPSDYSSHLLLIAYAAANGVFFSFLAWRFFVYGPRGEAA